MGMGNYRDLAVWRDGCRLASEVIEALKGTREYGLKDQMTRSSVSIPSNIAEGCGRGSDAEFVRFLRYARGSCSELRTQLEIARKTGFLREDLFASLDRQTESLSMRITKMINALRA